MKNKKGIQLTMEVIVIVIVLLALLLFLLVFFTGQGSKLGNMWDYLVGRGVNETQIATQ